MDNKIISIANEILELEDFNLYLYYKYIAEYDKNTMLKVFSYILKMHSSDDSIFYKYFDAFLSIELDDLKITRVTYNILCKKYGEERINDYFINLLEYYGDNEEFKNKYSLIYKHITFGDKSFFSDDSVRLYLNSIDERILTKEEEKECFSTLDMCRKNIKIASFNDVDSIIFDDFDKVICSIRTLKQLKLLNKIKDTMIFTDKNKFNDVYTGLRKYFKTNDELTIENSNRYDQDFFDKQLMYLSSFCEARQLLINCNLRLVVSIAKNYRGYNMHILDFIQEGNLGLMRAVKRFDSSYGNRLSTYSTYWIKQAMQRCINEQARFVRIPVHIEEKIQKINRASRILEAKYGYPPSDEEIAAYLKYSIDDVIFIKNRVYNTSVLSLNASVNQDDDSVLEQFVNNGSPDSFDVVAEKELEEISKIALDTLTEKEKFVLINRLGIQDGKSKTLEEVGKILGVTRERIRQIENKAIRKLRHPTRRKLFDGYH